MDSINNFLYFIGIYNLLGSIFLIGLLYKKVAITILTIQFRIFTNNYSIGEHGHLWLIWSIILNIFLGYINYKAIGWDSIAQYDLLIADLVAYSIFIILSIVALFNKKYSIGIWFNFPIFGFWIIWAIYLLFT